VTESAAAVTDEAEIIVVGAGPAGATCAALLAEWGHDVLIVDQDRFPRDKPCGDGLTRSAVALLVRLGMQEIVARGQPISGVRVVTDHRAHRFQPCPPQSDQSPGAICIRRTVLDKALLDAAIARGGRFVQARVDGLATRTGVHGVTARVGGESIVLAAPVIVAADGATSRLRRQCGYSRLGEQVSAFAVRAYYSSERPLDPVFDVYVPLAFQGRGLAGYGWVFPVSDQIANVGVACWHGAGVPATKGLRQVLSDFADGLRGSQRARFGQLEPISEPHGSPLAIEFAPQRCRVDGVVFVGDAARTTDPLSGEGIAYALNGGETVAQWIHARRTGQRPRADVGKALGRRFPRLGQDVSLPARLAERRLNRPSQEGGRWSPHPFVSEIERMIMSDENEPAVAQTPVGSALADDGRALAALEEVVARTVDRVTTRFPFAAELLARELQSRLGPLAAATAILVTEDAADRPDLIAGAAACELIRVGSRCSAQLVDRPRDEQAKLNNVLCVLITDFALSRAFAEATLHSPSLVADLAGVLRQICVGRLSDGRQAYDPARPASDYLRAAAAKGSPLFRVACRLGTAAGSTRPDAHASLGELGRDLGLAYQLADDLLDFLAADRVTGRPAAAGVRAGIYPLPVLFAQARDPELRRLLNQALTAADVTEVIQRVTVAGGVDEALVVLRSTVERTAATLARVELAGSPALTALVELPYAQVLAHQQAPQPPSEHLSRIAAAA
jgi:geranylgeranyl reductase family protein